MVPNTHIHTWAHKWTCLHANLLSERCPSVSEPPGNLKVDVSGHAATQPSFSSAPELHRVWDVKWHTLLACKVDSETTCTCTIVLGKCPLSNKCPPLLSCSQCVSVDALGKPVPSWFCFITPAWFLLIVHTPIFSIKHAHTCYWYFSQFLSQCWSLYCSAYMTSMNRISD